MFQTGDRILFSTTLPFQPLPEAIKFILGSKYHHSGVMGKKADGWKIYESIMSGINRTHALDYANHYKVQVARIPGANTPESIPILDSLVGIVKYDYMSLLVYLPILIGTKYWVGRTEEKAWKRMVCMEFDEWYYNQILGIYPYWYGMNSIEFIEDKRFTDHIIFEDSMKNFKKELVKSK